MSEEPQPANQIITVKPALTFFDVAKYIMIGAVLIGLLIWAVSSCRQERKGRLSAEKHVRHLQNDSTGMVATINRLSKQANDALAYSYRYKAAKDSAIASRERSNSKLSYFQKVTRYLQGLVANKTLPAPTPTTPLPLTDEQVVTAGLNTVDREAIERKRGDSLAGSIAVRDAQLTALRVDSLRQMKQNYKLLTGYQAVIDTATALKKGGIWPLNHKRRKQLKAVATVARQQISDLEKELNQ